MYFNGDEYFYKDVRENFGNGNYDLERCVRPRFLS
jgi:hypothetical protein